MNDVCSLELLTNAVANRLSADEESALYDHLERCEACCARMEQLAGGEQWQQEAAALLTTDELDAAVPELMVWSEVDFSVEHLEPSEDANVLGQLGGYDVLAIIGRGGMGVVLKAFDRELKRFVAIKALSPHLAHSSVARKRFAREAQAAAAVVNPHVIAIHHVQPTGRLPFLIMPLLTGESLAQRLKSRAPLELTEVLRIGMQAAVGLAAAHDQGLVHRDVKPANIFLEKGVERVVITDFGLARAADDVSMTRLGVVAGTPEYMSPEQARGEALDSRSDLFSLGCVLYEMATGVSPFRSDSTIATLRRIVDDRPAAIASLAPELPPWFSYIVERLLSKDPTQRFASASEVSQLLEACLSHLQQPASVPLPASLVPHANRRRSIFNSNKKGILTMLGTLGTALLGMMLWQGTEAPDISGEWTSDEWGTVVLEAKEPGQYEGTFGGNDKTGNPTTGNLPPEKEPLTAWGKEVGGLQAGLGLDYGNRRTYGHGEVITLVVRLRNVGKEAVKFRYLRQDLYENLAVTDAGGEAVPQCNTKFMPPNDPESEKLEPGKEIVLKTRMHGSNGMPFVLIPSNSEDLELNENFRPLVVGIGKVQLQIEKVFGTFSFDFPKLSTGTLELEVNNQPGGSEFSGSSSKVHPAGSPRASGVPPRSNKGESGTLHLKWSRVERRFNGTWGVGAARRGTMSLRLVDKEIRGGWTTNEDVQLETGTPLLGDLSWTRSAVPVSVGSTDLRGATTQLVDTPRLPVSVAEGGNVSAGEAVMTPLTIPPGDIGVAVYAGRGLWYSQDKEIDKLLNSINLLRGVTVQVHEDGTGDAFTKAEVHDPVPVREEPAETQKREEWIRRIKIAIDEALRAHKVPNIRWLDGIGKQQDGPASKKPQIDTAFTARIVVEAWVTAVIAKDVKTASSLAKHYPARADQIEAWGNGWKLSDFSVGTVKTDEQSSPPRALVVSAKEMPVTLPVEGQPAASFLVFELKLMKEGWSIIDVGSWDTVENAVEHFQNGDPDVLRPMPVDIGRSISSGVPATKPTEKSETTTELPNRTTQSTAIPLIEKPKLDRGKESENPEKSISTSPSLSSIQAAVTRLLAQLPHFATPQGDVATAPIAFLGIDYQGPWSLGDFKDQLEKEIEAQISQSSSCSLVSRRMTEAAMAETRVKLADLVTPIGMKSMTQSLRSQDIKIQGLMFARLKHLGDSDSSRNGEFEVSLELFDVNLHSYKESATARHDRSPSNSRKKEPELLQGRWIIESWSRELEDQLSNAENHFELRIDGHAIHVFDDVGNQHASMLLDEQNIEPVAYNGIACPVNYVIDPNGDRIVCPGILDLDGERLRICYSRNSIEGADSDKFRPSLFIPGSKVTLIECRRAEPETENASSVGQASNSIRNPQMSSLPKAGDVKNKQQIGTVPGKPIYEGRSTRILAPAEVDETLKSLIESLKPLQGDWVVELPGTQFYPADKLGDSAVSHFVMRIRTNHVELRPFPHSGEQPVSKLLLHPIQDAKPGHFLVDTDPSAVDQRFSPGEFSFEVQDNQLHVKLIPAKSSESNRPDQGSEAPKGFSARRETEGFSARRATDEEQRKFAQDRLQHMRMVGYKNADRTNPEAVVEAYVAASLAGDVAIATCLAEGYAARPDQSTGWNKHWNLNDFAIKSVRVRGQVVTPMRVTAKEAIVVSELMHRTSPATIGDVSVGHHVTFLKNINGKWVVSAFDLWTAEHYNKGIGNFLNAAQNSLNDAALPRYRSFDAATKNQFPEQEP